MEVEERGFKITKMVYEGDRVEIELCFSDGRCYRGVYRVLDREEWGWRLALLIGESNFDAVISFVEGDLPGEDDLEDEKRV